MDHKLIIEQSTDIETAIQAVEWRRNDVYQAILNQGASNANEKRTALIVAISPDDSIEAAVHNIQQNSPDVAQALINKGIAQAAESKVKVDAGLAMKMAFDAKTPELAMQMIDGGMNVLEARNLIATSNGIRDICAAANLPSDTFQHISPHLSDSVRLVGLMIHQVQAQNDDSNRIEGHVCGEHENSDNKKSGSTPEDVINNRKSASSARK